MHSDVVSGAQGSSQYAEPCAAIVGSSDRLIAVLGNTSEMVQQTKALAQVCVALNIMSNQALINFLSEGCPDPCVDVCMCACI
jgi:hypothetical protein